MIIKFHHILLIALSFCMLSCGRSDTIQSHSTKQKEYFIDSDGGKVALPAFADRYEDVIIRTGFLSSRKASQATESWINLRAMSLGYSSTKHCCIPRATLTVAPNEKARKRKATVIFNPSSSYEKEKYVVIQYGKSE